VAALDFDAFFVRVLPAVERVAGRVVGGGPAAEDCAVEALARAYSRWPTVGSMERPEAWVLRVATNLALDTVRRKRTTQSLVPVGSRTDDVELRQALVAALRQLPKRQQEVVVLRYIADLAEPDVASALHMSLGTVKTHLRRAMPHLRTILTSATGDAHAF